MISSPDSRRMHEIRRTGTANFSSSETENILNEGQLSIFWPKIIWYRLNIYLRWGETTFSRNFTDSVKRFTIFSFHNQTLFCVSKTILEWSDSIFRRFYTPHLHKLGTEKINHATDYYPSLINGTMSTIILNLHHKASLGYD